jgi:hypothetical protein
MKSAKNIVLAGIALSLTPALVAGAPTTGPLIGNAPQRGNLRAVLGNDAGTTVTSPTAARLPGGNTHDAPSSVTIGATPMEFSVDCTLDGRLDVNDFVCFQKAFVAGSPSANCDGSGSTPMLTVLDFMCFLNEFNAKVSSQGGRISTSAGSSSSGK